MNIVLGEEAVAFGTSVHKALEAAGGDQLVQQIERDPERRASLVAPLLGELGAWDLDPSVDLDQLEAAASLCRTIGYWAVPYPAGERLARPRSGAADGLLVVAEDNPAGAIAGLDLHWEVVTLRGRRRAVGPVAQQRSPRAGAFVAHFDLALGDPPVDDQEVARVRSDAAFGLVLPCWTLLGMLDRALELTRQHVLEREQFGKPLAAFQGVQFQLTDAEVERAGTEVLALHALWSVGTRQPGALADALACRLAAVEAADVVFRVAHQLHGAIGFCDETTISWVSRYSTPLRRLPYGPTATQVELERVLGRHGLDGPFAEVCR